MIGKHLLRHAALALLLFSFLNSAGQQGSSKYPQGYFRNPLDIPMSLSANFGELRPGHWHMGLDLRTNQRENLAVFAAADGYIAHIGIRPMSFGRFIIIRHANGYSTLYAHLNQFYPELEKFVRDKQKEKRSWPIDIDFTGTSFKVEKGKEIGKSGNTGGSQGPHLHFEIRDTETGKCLNPQLFGYNIKDDVPPAISRLAMYDRNISTWLQTPQIIKVVKTSKGYSTSPAKILTGSNKISFAISTTDRVSGSSGPNGTFGFRLYYDAQLQITYTIDNIDYDESDYINAHIDKRYKNAGGPYVQHLSRLPGFKGHIIYEPINGTGVIELNDTLTHNISIEVFDANENVSTLSFQIKFSDKLAAKTAAASQRMLLPNQVNIIEEKEFEAYLPDYSLYDSIAYVYNQQNIFSPEAVTAQHRLSDPVYPTHLTFPVKLKMTRQVSEELKGKIVIERKWKNERTVRKAEWQNGWLSASFGDFGIFQGLIDTIAPKINAPGKGNDTLDLSSLSRIIFTPTDNSSVRSFRAELDGEWLKFSNDKGRNHIYIFDEQCPFGIHELKVRVEDIVGNVTEKTWVFKKYPYTPPKKKVVKKKAAAKKKTSTKKK
jgi:murein DD-endopeptidase MepM/ murein hydrolase activator NlpD